MKTIEYEVVKGMLPEFKERYPLERYPNITGIGAGEMERGSQRFGYFRLHLEHSPSAGERRIYKSFRGIPVEIVYVGPIPRIPTEGLL